MKQLNIYNLTLSVDGYGVDAEHEAKMVLEAINDAIEDLRGAPVLTVNGEVKAEYARIATTGKR